jgi:hypothetical protein
MNVRDSYLRQGGPTVIAYSPVTGDSYEMDCRAGYSARLAKSLMATIRFGSSRHVGPHLVSSLWRVGGEEDGYGLVGVVGDVEVLQGMGAAEE